MRKRMLLSFAALAMFVVTMSGQKERRSPPVGNNPQTPVVFKGAGTPIPETSIPKPPPPPPDLSAEAKAAIAKAFASVPGPGTVYVKLTPLNNHVVSKGSIFFKNAYWVSGANEVAQWAAPADEQEKRLGIQIKSEGPGRHYLIDCAVESYPAYTLKIWSANKVIQSVQGTGVKGQHLVSLLETTDHGWYSFDISGGASWYFYSCEVTRL